MIHLYAVALISPVLILIVVITLITLGGGRYPWETARSDEEQALSLSGTCMHRTYPVSNLKNFRHSNSPHFLLFSHTFNVCSFLLIFYSSILLRFLSTCFCHSFFLSLISSTKCSFSLFHDSISTSLHFNSHHHHNIPPSNQTPLSQHYTRLFGITAVCYLVLDEADRMLDDGFEPAIRQVSKSVRIYLYLSSFPSSLLPSFFPFSLPSFFPHSFIHFFCHSLLISP